MKLDQNELNSHLADLHRWKQNSDSIYNEFELKDFTDAISFVVGIGIESEKMDHHPTITIHSWNKVKVDLTTHDEGGISEKDIKLAKKIDDLV